MYDRMRKDLRHAGPSIDQVAADEVWQLYSRWLEGYLLNGGSFENVYDYPAGRKFKIARQDAVLPRAGGAKAQHLLVPPGVNVTLKDSERSHSTVWNLNDFSTTADEAPVYSDVRFPYSPFFCELTERLAVAREEHLQSSMMNIATRAPKRLADGLADVRVGDNERSIEEGLRSHRGSARQLNELVCMLGKAKDGEPKLTPYEIVSDGPKL
jgi:hypothetical protein